MLPVCDIIVLTYNKLEVTKLFFESLKKVGLPIRVIVIDNASSDNTRDYLKTLENSEKCTFDIIFNRDNDGFVNGMNQGIAISKSPYVCLANNDLIFTEQWLDEIIGLFEKNNDIGVLNPNSNTLGSNPVEGQSLESFAGELHKRYKGVFVEMPFCIGFCMVIRKALLDKVGGLSKEYVPMFFEDTDLSLKAAREGYLIGVAKGAYVWHKEHGSFKEKSDDIEGIFKKNKALFERKWGKINRVAWFVTSFEELLKGLPLAASIARKGNFLTVYIKNVDKKREDIFKKAGIFEHSGVQFKSFNNYFNLIMTILFKKKKFDFIITGNNIIKTILRSFKYQGKFAGAINEVFNEV